MTTRIPKHLKTIMLIAGIALLSPLTGVYADSTENFTPSLVSPSVQEDSSLLGRRLQGARKDLEQYLAIAEYFSTNGDARTVEQLQLPVEDFLKRHVENLLSRGMEQPGLETTRLCAEIMFIRTRLFSNLNQPEAARASVAEMKRRFGSFQKNTIQAAGKSVMLSEAIRQLDEELANPARSKRK